MSTTARQNNLLLNEDWTRIYQTFRNADFKSYDFENLRRVIITYLRENYPEDFNDYIESSEYLALIDAIAFLGQSLSFRVDLASRENFIELAERKESVLRLARMLSYNAKRNKCAQGLLKFRTVSTTENLVDGNGRNIANQIISWNDPTNANWAEQFTIILNSAMADNTEFGRSQGNALINGIRSEQYRFRTTTLDVPVYTFNKSVAGKSMAFEIISTSFKGRSYIYEESPTPGNQLGFVYRNDGKGAGSANTGFYLMFKQGSLEVADFSISVPTSNERIAIDSPNINNDDVWLYKLSATGAQQGLWTKVSSLTGNNIAYNSVNANIRNIYNVETKENDRIDLVFADGVYGNLPQGAFRLYYRVSNGLSYSVLPSDMKGININVKYLNKAGVEHTLTIGLGLESTVSSATPAESIDTIKQNAPATYYTQNRMITAEDYNLAPLSSSQDILKVKSINRTSSGISRNLDILDASGKYSSIRVFADDGYIYKEEGERNISFKFTGRTEIIAFIKNSIEPLFSDTDVYNFYLTKFSKILFTDNNTSWTNVTSEYNRTTGYFKNAIDGSLLKVSSYATNNLKYILPGANIKFTAPEGQAFEGGKLVTADSTNPKQTSYRWTKIVNVSGDGTNAGRGVLSSGRGAISVSDDIPTGAIASRIVPKFVNDLPVSLEAEMSNYIFNNINFGLRYDRETASWKIIQSANLDLTNSFSLGKAGDTSNEAIDSSWMIAFVKKANEYLVRIRKMDYIFGSVEENRFYLDVNDRAYNSTLGKVVKDQIKILGINTGSDLINPLVKDVNFEIDDTIKFDDGYESNEEIKIAFTDSDQDGVIDDPQSFEEIVGEDLELSYLFFQESTDDYGSVIYTLIDTDITPISVVQKESLVNVNDYDDGDLIYFYDPNENRVKRVDKTTNTLILESSYKANLGRRNLKFEYIHNASSDRRIDPSVSNIIDIYLLTRSYDTAYRQFLLGVADKPDAPTTDSLRVSFGSSLNAIKSISDEIVYHPVKYKVLFGGPAEEKLQATFKVVKNSAKVINTNDLKVRIIAAINRFFNVSNWDFGDRFYLSELNTYVLNQVAPDVTNLVIVPKQSTQAFGSLFEVQSKPDEIFVSGATVDDIEVVSAITAAEIRASSGTIVSN